MIGSLWGERSEARRCNTRSEPSELPDRLSPLYNEDLAPASPERRHWAPNFAALWISMSVNILTYMLAASLIQGGRNWKQAITTVFIGNVIVLAPMLLNSHPGAKYGIAFPVLARASFGVLGANIARFCVRSSPADGSALRAGLAARPSARCSQFSLPAGKTFLMAPPYVSSSSG